MFYIFLLIITKVAKRTNFIYMRSEITTHPTTELPKTTTDLKISFLLIFLLYFRPPITLMSM